MEEDVVEWEQAVDRGKAGAARAEVAWAVPKPRELEVAACVRNAERRNHTNAACPASSANARSVEPS